MLNKREHVEPELVGRPRVGESRVEAVQRRARTIPWQAGGGASPAPGGSVERGLFARDRLGELGVRGPDGCRDLVGADSEELVAQPPAEPVRLTARALPEPDRARVLAEGLPAGAYGTRRSADTTADAGQAAAAAPAALTE